MMSVPACFATAPSPLPSPKSGSRVEKHATGFYKEVIDYCLDAEGITLDDVDLVVRNCYILPVEEMEKRLVYQDMPGFLPEEERAEASKHPLYLSRSDKVVTVSHHLAHAYSAFAVSPFEEGVVMVVDGVGSYQSGRHRALSATDTATPLARESESYYKFSGTKIECLKKVWMEPDRGFLSDEFYNMPGLGALYSRASTYIFGDWNKCGELMGLAPYGRPRADQAVARTSRTASRMFRIGPTSSGSLT